VLQVLLIYADGTGVDGGVLLLAVIRVLQVLTDLCVTHGGGRRCTIEGCTNSAVGATEFHGIHYDANPRVHKRSWSIAQVTCSNNTTATSLTVASLSM
jgi:hypothetical protein